MSNDFGVKWRFGVVDNLTAPIKNMAKSFKPMVDAAKSAHAQFNLLQKNTENLRKKFDKAGSAMKNAGKTMTAGVTAPVIALEALAVKSFADFEQGVVDVVKTTGLEFGEVEKIIMDLSKKMPVPIDGLLEIAGAAGQLGVKGTADIALFTETMAKMEKATDIAGEDGAKAIVRLLNVAGEGIPMIEKFGSTIVALGNNSAASESEILEVATRVGQATAQFKLGSKNILGLSAGMKSLGINAEAGGTVIGKSFLAIASAVDKGGDKMKVLEVITGMTSDTIKKTFKTDANQVFLSFLKGMGELEKKGISNTRALAAFGLSGDRVNAILPTMVQGFKTVSDSMAIAESGFTENIALQEEFNVQTQTANSLFASFSNIIKRVSIDFGKVLFPAVAACLKVLGGLVEIFGGLSPTVKTVIVVFATLAAMIGPVLLGFGMLLTMIPNMITGFALLKVGLAALGITGWAALLPFIKFIAIAALLAASAYAVMESWGDIKDFMKDLFTQPLQQIMDMIYYGGHLAKKVGSWFGWSDGKSNVDRQLEAQGFKMADGAQGAPLGADEVLKKSADMEMRQQRAVVDMNFSNIPMGTKIITDNKDGVLNMNTGMIGAL